MSLAYSQTGDRRPSEASMELGTNNPFRARLSVAPPLSPASDSGRFSFQSTTRERPVSRNPFLDVADDDVFDFDPPQQPRSVHRANSFDTTRPALTGSAAELFENLTLTSDPPSSNMSSAANESDRRQPPPPPAPRQARGPMIRRDSSNPEVDKSQPLINISSFGSNDQPAGRRLGPPSGSRPLNGERSRDRDRDRERDRERERRPRPRRNSDSSVVEAHEVENRRRERSGRDARSKDSRSRRDTDKSKKKHPALDVIDKLDVTGVYGSGLFHHDGPFDACNPHRNKSSRRLAPVQAFPEDSANNSMTGFGPRAEKADHSHVFGNREPEAFHDYTTAAVRPSASRAISFDPKAPIQTVHGAESMGLGTSTFLDGAPASIKAQQAANEERPRSSSDAGFQSGGLQRKKSLAQKIRSISSQNKAGPDGPLGPRRRAPAPPGGRRSPTSDGRPSPSTPMDNAGNNPFFNDFADDGKEQAPNSPRRPHPGLNRVNTDDPNTVRLMKRVRSLSKSKRRE